MIQAILYFDGDYLGDAVTRISTLPEAIRPTHFSAGEKVEDKANLLSNAARFGAFMKRHETGFFLMGAEVLYNVSIKGKLPSTIAAYCDSAALALHAETMLGALSQARPVFGFVADQREYHHRNRLAVSLGNNKVEAWVGRDVNRYVPGIYWITLLSDALCRRHGLETRHLVQELGAECLPLGECQTVLKLYNQPEDWEKHVEQVDLACLSNGVFSITKVTSDAARAANIMDLQALLSLWK